MIALTSEDPSASHEDPSTSQKEDKVWSDDTKEYCDEGPGEKDNNSPNGSKDVGDAAAVRQSNWSEDFASEVQPMPPPAPRRVAPNVLYDHRGRPTKTSVLQDRAMASRVGAFAFAGPAPLSRRPAPREMPDSAEQMEEGGQEDAPAPEEELIDAEVTVSPSCKEKSSPAPFWMRKPFMVGALLLFLMVVVLAVIIPLVISNNVGGDAMSHEGTNPPTPAQSVYIAPIPNLSNATLAEIEVESTIPYQAYQFVTQDPNWNTYEAWRKQQRFALACIFYAFGGWLQYSNAYSDFNIGPHLYNQHECEWGTPFDQRCPGDDEGVVKVIEIAWVSTNDGHIPREVALLSHLEVLSIISTWLVNSDEVLPLDVPNSLPSLKELSIVDCGDKNQGTIPSKLGLLTSLTKLDLSDSKLDSTIPSELGLLSNLTSLILVDNLLSGTIPEEIGLLSSLVNFEADGNSALEPFIPSGFCLTNHTDEWKSMRTEWCSNPTECCTTA